MRFDYFEQFYENLKEDFDRLGFTKDEASAAYDVFLAQYKYDSNNDTFTNPINNRVYNRVGNSNGFMYRPQDMFCLKNGDTFTSFYKKDDYHLSFNSKIEGNDFVCNSITYFIIDGLNVKNSYCCDYIDVIPGLKEDLFMYTLDNIDDYLRVDNKFVSDLNISITCYNPDDIKRYLDSKNYSDEETYNFGLKSLQKRNKIKVVEDGKIIEDHENYEIDFKCFESRAVGIAENYYRDYKKTHEVEKEEVKTQK